MDVPLAAYRAIANEKQYIDVWTAHGRQRVEAPFLPYCFAKDRRSVGAIDMVEEEVRPVSTLQPERWVRYDFPNVRGVSEMSRGEKPLEMADNHVAYIERVLIDTPQFFTQYPHGRDPTLMVFDIEQLTTGDGFPTEREPLISIAWCLGDGPIECVMADGKNDRDIIAKFLAAVEAADPDVLVGYNLTKYDLPMLLKRARIAGLDTSKLGRGDRLPDESRDGDLVLEGRLIYDVSQDVLYDQTLHGIKDRRLKTVGKWHKFEVIEEDVTDTRELVGTERLAEYNRSDVRLTRDISKIYWRNHLALAEFYGAPLNVVLRATAIFHTNILQGRVFRQAEPRIISDGTNDQRYQALYRQAGGQAFVGGIVEIYQRGLFEPLWKVDFSSMYPSIMVSLGCGADNTRLAGTEALGDFQVSHHGDLRRYSIPDESRGANLVIEVEGISPMALELKRLLEVRFDLKKKAKATLDVDERERLHARQNVIKVVLNSIYGNMASPFARYGSLPVAVATVGLARRLIRVVEQEIGDAKVETDTDGIYTAAEPDIEGLNDAVARFMIDEVGSADNLMRLDMDAYDAGYFHERKTYLLLHDDGRIEKHGVAFKASSACGVFDKTLDAVSRALLLREGDPVDVGRAAFDLSQYDERDFVMRVKLGKRLDEYAAANAVGAQIARKYIEKTGREPKRGEQLEYIKTADGYDLPSVVAYERLDRDYYKGIVETVLDRLAIDWRPTKQVKLDFF